MLFRNRRPRPTLRLESSKVSRRKIRNNYRAGFELLESRCLLAGDIAGTVFQDLNNNGVRDVGAHEDGLAGWTLFIDSNLDGVLTSGEPTQVTNVDGDYLFTGVAAGPATVYEVLQGGWAPSAGLTDHRTITVLNDTEVKLDFGNSVAAVGTIRGTVWNDADGDGTKDAGESGLSGWTVFLDDNNNGVRDIVEATTVSDSTGAYAFSSVSVGAHRVTEILPTGWTPSEGFDSRREIGVSSGGVAVVDFYNLTPEAGTIGGTVWNDVDGDGALTAGEAGLDGWQVYVDVDGNGVLDAGETYAVTDAAGAYTLYGVAYGTATVREVTRPGWLTTSPSGGVRTVFLTSGGNVGGVSFGNREQQEAVIAGTAFVDANKNGIRDAGERGLGGITVFLDTNDNGMLDAAEKSIVTSSDLFYTPGVDEAGTYSFSRLARGEYRIREIIAGELGATPATVVSQLVSLGSIGQTTVDFANRFRPNEIHGVVFDDADEDRVRDPGEAGRDGVTVFLDADRDGVLDADETSTITAADGSYAFLDLAPGAYVVREILSTDRSVSYPATRGGILSPGGISNPAIGNVTPGIIDISLAKDEVHRRTVSLTLPGSGGITNLVDVFLLFDDTGSFTSNSPVVRAAFPTIISTLQSALPGIDLGFGVGRFEEYGGFAGEYATGRPFILNQPIVASSTAGFAAAIQAALDRTTPGFGGDAPETDIEALYQLVTGRGFDGNNNGSVLDGGAAGPAATQLNPGGSGDVPSFASFTSDPTNGVLAAAGNVGGAGFRAGALPVVLLATDTGFAYQPKGETTVAGVGGVSLPLSALTQAARTTTPFNYGAGIQETVTGLNALGALVIGLGTNAEATIDPRQQLEALAKLTGAVNRTATTIGNGTADAVAPGDPFYFLIQTGFAGTVASGVVNAIQNAVTGVAVDITLKASDPRVRIINRTGTLAGIGAGQTATFDVEFVGDGIPHRFDLQFVRAGTDVVLGSIPVVIGTPIVGDGYEFEDLVEGEIELESHFGDHVAHTHAPTDITLSASTFAPDAPVGTVVGTLSAVDADAYETFRFALVTGPGSEDNAAFGIVDNQLVTATASTAGRRNYSVRIAVTDSAGAVFEKTWTLATTPLNAPPTIAINHGLTLFEGAAAVIDGTSLRTTDPDNAPEQLTYTLLSAPVHGALTYGEATLSGGSKFTQADLDAGRIAYRHDGGETIEDGFQFAVSDGTVSLADAKFAIAVQSVDDAPTLDLNRGLTLAEGSAAAVTAAMLKTSDVDTADERIVYTITTAATHGVLQSAGVALGAGDRFTQADLNSDRLRYLHDGDEATEDAFGFAVTDGTAAPIVGTFVFRITPVNDAPVATLNLGLTLPEGASAVIDAASLSTSDADTPAAQIAYSLVSGPQHGVLTLGGAVLKATDTFTQADVNAGALSYAHDAGENFVDSFEFTVSDGIVALPAATFAVAVTPVNDAPVIADQTFILSNKAVAGTVIGTVTASDAEIGQTRTFALVGGDGATAIDSATGVLTVVDSKLLTTLMKYVVRVTDDGTPPLSAEAVVTIELHAQNSPPVFTLNDATGSAITVVQNKATIAIDESAASSATRNGTIVGTVSVTDVDEPRAVLSIAMTDKSGAFAFDAATGAITVADAGRLDYEKKKSFALTFQSTDHGLVGAAKSQTATLSLTVLLNDCNDAPKMAPTATFSLRENNPAKATVGVIEAADPDRLPSFKNLSYSLVSQFDESGNVVNVFALDAAKGALTVPQTSALDYELHPFYTLVVRATDGGGLSQDQAVTVRVGDVNEAPVLSLLDAAGVATSVLSVPENTAAGTLVGYVRVVNPDVGRNESIRLSAESTENLLNLGVWDPATGSAPILVGASKINFEALKSGQISLAVVATDSGFTTADGQKWGSTTGKAVFNVRVEDVNEAPVDVVFRAARISVTSWTLPVDTIVGRVIAVDFDATPQNVAFSLAAGTADNDLFFVDATTGQLRTSTKLPRKATYSVLVTATDVGGLSIDKLLAFRV